MNSLYLSLSSLFTLLVVLANLLSVKMVVLPFFSDYTIPFGVFLYPLTFLISDFITEIYGEKAARKIVYLSLMMNGVAICLIQLAIWTPSNNDNAFSSIFGLSNLRILTSLTSYLIALLIDIKLYAWIKAKTNGNSLWLRANGSTLFSQMIDTVLVDLIFLFAILGMELSTTFVIIAFSFAYKAIISLLLTPVYYLAVKYTKSNRVPAHPSL